MSSTPYRRPALFLLVATLALGTTACDLNKILDVTDPDVVTPQQLSGPTAIPTVVAGVVGTFQDSYNDLAWFTAMFTDEMIHAGTFTGWQATDDRDVSIDKTSSEWDEVQVARQFAEDAIDQFEESQGDPDFEGVSELLSEGIALANFYAGYQHVLMGEFYCEAVIDEVGEVVPPAEMLQAGIGFLGTAESAAGLIGRTDLVHAARVGQARANLQMGNYDQAASLVSSVPDDFLFVSEYSANTPDQENQIFQLSFGVNAVIRASVGDGTQENRHRERWAYFDEWVEQGLIDPDPDLTAFESSVRVQAQLLHSQRGSDIHLASGWEARMIEAEAMLRSGQVQSAEDLVNSLLANDDQSVNPMSMLNSELGLGAFKPVDFIGTMSEDLREMARARASGLWLSTDRQATLRRYKVLDGVDLYPPLTLGDDHCFPIPRDEANTNPNVPG